VYTALLAQAGGCATRASAQTVLADFPR